MKSFPLPGACNPQKPIGCPYLHADYAQNPAKTPLATPKVWTTYGVTLLRGLEMGRTVSL